MTYNTLSNLISPFLCPIFQFSLIPTQGSHTRGETQSEIRRGNTQTSCRITELVTWQQVNDTSTYNFKNNGSVELHVCSSGLHNILMKSNITNLFFLNFNLLLLYSQFFKYDYFSIPNTPHYSGELRTAVSADSFLFLCDSSNKTYPFLIFKIRISKVGHKEYTR